MKIAVDIDDTLNVVDRLGRASAYAARLRLPYKVKNENSNFFVEVLDWDEEAVLQFMRAGGIAAFTEAEAKKGAAQALAALRAAGHEIIILTARQKLWFGNPVSVSRDWLQKRKIPYDEIVAEVWDKGAYCAEHGIEILVDDNPDILLEAERRGVRTVLFLGKHNLSRASSFLAAPNWQAAKEHLFFLTELITVEKLTLQATPARRSERIGAFCLSLDDNKGRRGNCATRTLPENVDLRETLLKLEETFSREGKPCRFLLTNADSLLDGALEERGYAREVSAACYELTPLVSPAPARSVFVGGEADSRWRAALAAAEGGYTGYFTPRRYALVRGECVFVCAYEGETPVGAAMGVLAEGRVGIFDLRVRQEYRRQGYGRALVETILQEAAKSNATRAYFQTETGNGAAIALLRRLGFSKIYDYWYRVK